MSSELIEDLLKGSAELNRLRSETNQIVRMSLGRIAKIFAWDERLKIVSNGRMSIRAGGCVWKFQKREKKIEALCLIDGPMGGSSCGYVTEHYRDLGWIWQREEISVHDVQFVRKNLTQFVEELTKVYPELKQDIEALCSLA